MSVTVFDNHAEPGKATHVVTCTNLQCPKRGVPVVAPPLPGHASGKKHLREVIYCGECQAAITWAKVRPIAEG